MRRDVAATLTMIGLMLGIIACSATQVHDRTDEAAQATELAGCITAAKALDAGPDARLAAYTTCADAVDAKHGVTK